MPEVTYRMANGELVYGEYNWVTELEFFEELDEPVEIIKETWKLEKSETLTLKPSWWSNEKGASMIEYAILLVFLCIVAGWAAGCMGLASHSVLYHSGRLLGK